MNLYVKWLGVALFLCGVATFLIAMLFFTASGASRMRALVSGAFQARSDYTATGWRIYKAGVATAMLGFVLVVVAEFGFLLVDF